jgi:hypothetical protein
MDIHGENKFKLSHVDKKITWDGAIDGHLDVSGI